MNYLSRLWQRFRDEHFGQLAASLSFTTLLSLVPLVTVIVTLSSSLPMVSGLIAQLDSFFVENLLPTKSGAVIARYTLSFSAKARQLTYVGTGVLVVTAYLLMFSIERAFNHLWRVPRPRPLLQRVWRYGVVLLLGPLVAGALLLTTTQALTLSLGFFDESAAMRRLLGKTLAIALLCALFAFIYYAVPNVRVRPRHALLGGVLAAVGILALQRLFELYLVLFPAYAKIYGAFAAVPIFLLWLYASWVVVLLGALIVANFPVAPSLSPRMRSGRAGK